MATAAFFHEGSGRVRFWVQVDDVEIGASVSQDTLRCRYSAQATDENPMATFRAHLASLENAVRKRVARGSIEPVILRETDLHDEDRK